MIRKIGVIGAGQTGQGVSWCAAQNGIDVIYVEKCDASKVEARKQLEAAIDNEIARWALTETEKKVILSRIQGTTRIEDLKDVDMVVECVPELIEIKSKVFAEICEKLPKDLVLATHTLALSVTELSSTLSNPERLVGMHFLVPVQKRPLVEIVRGLRTSTETVMRAREFGEAIGKTCVEVTESPGYITTRLIIPFLNEAMTVVMEGVATVQDVDASMRLGYDLPMGPLELADRMGLDEVMFGMEELFREFGDQRYRPNFLLRKMVRAGRLGLKSHCGFYRYDENGRRLDTCCD